jgi:uncharacterized protein (DUF433 family)
MEWGGCELVEVIPGKVSRVPLVVGTRIPAHVISRNSGAGSSMDEIKENYPALSLATIARLLSFAAAGRERRIA